MTSALGHVCGENKALACDNSRTINHAPAGEVHETFFGTKAGDGDGRRYLGGCGDWLVEPVVLFQPVCAAAGQIHAKQPGHHAPQQRGWQLGMAAPVERVGVIDQAQVVDNVAGSERSGWQFRTSR